MDEETEKALAGILERIIKRYRVLEERMNACKEDFRELNKDMMKASIILRDKHTWRIKEMDREIRKLAGEMESKPK